MRRHLQAVVQHFTVVTWDLRGAGTSYRELDPADSVTLAGYVADTIELTEHLRDRFDTDQIYLVGQSWGTTLGVLAVQQRPDLVSPGPDRKFSHPRREDIRRFGFRGGREGAVGLGGLR